MIEAMGIGAADINFACIPLSHSYALGNIVMPLLLQGTAVALRQSFNPSQFMADVAICGRDASFRACRSCSIDFAR